MRAPPNRSINPANASATSPVADRAAAGPGYARLWRVDRRRYAAYAPVSASGGSRGISVALVPVPGLWHLGEVDLRELGDTETYAAALDLDLVPVLYRGLWDKPHLVGPGTIWPSTTVRSPPSNHPARAAMAIGPAVSRCAGQTTTRWRPFLIPPTAWSIRPLVPRPPI